MKKQGFAVGLMFVLVVAGCASEVEEEEVGQSAESELRSAASWECAQGNGLYCGKHGVFGDPRQLFRCQGGRVSGLGLCAGGCIRMPDGQNDKCATTIGGGDGPPQAACPYGNGMYCGGNGVAGQPSILYSCSDGVVKGVRSCANGCRRMPAGYNDQCN